mmetsp:Transcript_62965/g.172591  ORF Transcript_62965/g.172591 Transcript_62965/m.172591 type:complete len:234 (+) Transcript_62965:3227-3928(+)
MACGFDAPPSKRGFEMLEERATPVGNFLTPRVECVFFSPLKRAEVTKTAVFGEYEGAPKDTSAVEVEVEVEGGGNQTIEKPPQVPLWFLKERSKRETCGPSCHLSNRVHRFDVEFLRRVPMDTFALVGHSVVSLVRSPDPPTLPNPPTPSTSPTSPTPPTPPTPPTLPTPPRSLPSSSDSLSSAACTLVRQDCSWAILTRGVLRCRRWTSPRRGRRYVRPTQRTKRWKQCRKR